MGVETVALLARLDPDAKHVSLLEKAPLDAVYLLARQYIDIHSLLSANAQHASHLTKMGVKTGPRHAFDEDGRDFQRVGSRSTPPGIRRHAVALVAQGQRVAREVVTPSARVLG